MRVIFFYNSMQSDNVISFTLLLELKLKVCRAFIDDFINLNITIGCIFLFSKSQKQRERERKKTKEIKITIEINLSFYFTIYLFFINTSRSNWQTAWNISVLKTARSFALLLLTKEQFDNKYYEYYRK